MTAIARLGSTRSNGTARLDGPGFSLLSRRSRGWLVAVAFAALSTPALAAKSTVPVAWVELVGMFDSALETEGVVGGSIALVENGKIVAHREHGYADRAKNRRVDPDTIFHWASITKTINAITVMQLRDRGLLSLDDPITRYVPELRRVHNPFGSMDAITIRMMLKHTAGFQGPTWPYVTGASWEPFEPTRWEQVVAMMPYQQIAFAPGSQFGYSNPSWIYLAHALEDLSGDPWEYYVQKNVFAPLGMSRSYFGRTPPHLQSQRSSRYRIKKGADGAPITEDSGGEFDPGITIPNGGWNSPLADVAAYIGFLTGANSRDAAVKQRYDSVLKRQTLEEMWLPERPSVTWQPQQSPVTLRDETVKLGLAFFVSDRDGRRVIGHTGSQGGFTAFFHCDPVSGRGVIGAFNTGNDTLAPGAPSAFSKLRTQALKVFD